MKHEDTPPPAASVASEFPDFFNFSTVFEDNYIQLEQFGLLFKSVLRVSFELGSSRSLAFEKCFLCLDRLGRAVDNWIDFLSHPDDDDDLSESPTSHCPRNPLFFMCKRSG